MNANIIFVHKSVQILPRAAISSISFNNNGNREPEWYTVVQNYQYSHQSAIHRDRCLCTHIWKTLQWSHNEHHGASNHRCIDCLLSFLFRHRSKKTSKLCVTGLCEGNSPDKGPVTRKMFPSDDGIMTDANGGWNKTRIFTLCTRYTRHLIAWTVYMINLKILKASDHQILLLTKHWYLWLIQTDVPRLIVFQKYNT